MKYFESQTSVKSEMFRVYFVLLVYLLFSLRVVMATQVYIVKRKAVRN